MESMQSWAQRILPLALTTGRTTTLVFPYPIKSADRGSADVLAQIVPEASNVLRVKAARQSFKPTNLTVITRGGELYEFELSYQAEPTQTVFLLSSGQAKTPMVTLKGPPLNDADLSSLSKKVIGADKNISIKDKSGLVTAVLNGIFIFENTLFFRLELSNRSPLNYEPASVRFSLSDIRRGKRTAIQQRELSPLYIYPNDGKVVQPGSSCAFVFALPQFTLAEQKKLNISLLEKGGERNLYISLRNKDILKASTFSQ
ncbi:Conjugative transposon protein TraN [Arcticibacter svalbardensis MN12-7]|uniref:Conjugative transposon protein TraN n=2 Tax=Arcticibacter TaxID=1288026 RepID=R9GX81_9SPHI|nr:Conjugative transposon protein TraN [Arcticibacter svalbardensis MN12-7]